MKMNKIKYTVTAEKAIENLIHNCKLLEDHIHLEEITEGYSDRWCKLLDTKNEALFQLGQWYYIVRTV